MLLSNMTVKWKSSKSICHIHSIQWHVKNVSWIRLRGVFALSMHYALIINSKQKATLFIYAITKS